MDSLLNLQEKVAKLLLSCQLDVFVFDLGFSWTLTPDEGARAPKACENKYKKQHLGLLSLCSGNKTSGSS